MNDEQKYCIKRFSIFFFLAFIVTGIIQPWIHESSHALACILTNSHINEFVATFAYGPNYVNASYDAHLNGGIIAAMPYIVDAIILIMAIMNRNYAINAYAFYTSLHDAVVFYRGYTPDLVILRNALPQVEWMPIFYFLAVLFCLIAMTAWIRIVMSGRHQLSLCES